MAEELPKMNIWRHIDALRNLLLRGGGVVLVISVALFCVMPKIFDRVVLAPTRGDFFLYRWLGDLSAISPIMPDLGADAGFNVPLININLASQFFIHMTASLWMAVVLSFPLLLWLVWGFVAPALYRNERRGAAMAFILGCGMFYAGVAVGYALVFPITLRFLAGYELSGAITNQISLDSYMDNFFMLILMMGIVFELPLLAWMLGKLGFLTRKFFSTYRRHAVVVLLILAAVITPTGDPFTLMVVFLPVYLLWEMSALLVPKPFVPSYSRE